ncbi:MAG: HAD-IA family hydrolase [Gaiellaceae bacterium]
MRLADLDAITVDAYGTTIELVDPAPALDTALRARGVERERWLIERAFAAEMEYYVPRSHEGRDAASLERLRQECAAVFLAALGADLDAGEFAPAYVGALVFRPCDGAAEALAELTARGLALAVVSNWDCSLPDHLEAAGLRHRFAAVVTSAGAGVPKPDPRIFVSALERLGVPARRALHVGDGPADSEGAAAAGLQFAPAPLSSVAGSLT